MSATGRIKKIPLRNNDGIGFVASEKVIYCKSDGNYTLVVMDHKRTLISKQLGVMEEGLSAFSFLRIHRSYLINLNHISKYVRNDGGYLIMSNGDKVDISRRKKQQLLALF